MTSADDVAAYVVARLRPVARMKLHRLVYYSQAWQLIWEDRPLFFEEIQAWANGPVVPELYTSLYGLFAVSEVPGGDAAVLAAGERETVDVVLDTYGRLSSHQLSVLARSEQPWRDARVGLHALDRGDREISLAAMAEYYGALDAADSGAARVADLPVGGWL